MVGACRVFIFVVGGLLNAHLKKLQLHILIIIN